MSMSTFGSLQIGRRGLQANQLALDVTGQNISNAGTPGYARQVANLTTTQPISPAGSAGQVGTGVEVASIKNTRDGFIDSQLRKAHATLGDLDVSQGMYNSIETIFNESSDAALSKVNEKFWSSLQDLSSDASSSSTRSAVLENAGVLAESLNHIYTNLQNVQKDCNDKIDALVTRVNTLAGQIGDLNRTIREVSATGKNPNDLMDEREKLTQELSQLANIVVEPTSGNEYNITIGGSTLVSGDNAYALATAVNPANNSFSDVVWKDTGLKANIARGEIGGDLKMRDGIVPSYLRKLDTFASTLIREFNTIHESGYGTDNSTGVAFFSGSGASDIAVAVTDLHQIAAASTIDASGNGDNATQLAKVMNKVQSYPDLNGMTLMEYYNSTVSDMAVNVNSTASQYENQKSLVNYYTNQQESASGVSLDDESVNLIAYENAYNASSRYVSVMDQILDTLINNTGTVGR